MMELPIENHDFATSIAQTSQGRVVAEGRGWMVMAPSIIIDLDDCAASVGRPLTALEREGLLHRHRMVHGVTVARMGNRIYLSNSETTGFLSTVVPLSMLDMLKANADERGITFRSLVGEMVDFYLASFGDSERERRELLAAATQKKGGGYPLTRGLTTERRSVTKMKVPQYPEHLLPTRTASLLSAWRMRRMEYLLKETPQPAVEDPIP